MKYWCDFTASILIEAENEAEAVWKFWETINKTNFQFCELFGTEKDNNTERDNNNERMV